VEKMQATVDSIEAPRIHVRASVSQPKSRGSRGTTADHLRALGGAASQLGTWLFWILVVAVLYFGWSIRDEGYLTAESGVGYALGIVGGTLMLLLLLYPLRKRMRSMRRWLHIRHWFRIHMLFGILGPVCILLHSGFRLGSMNGSVALLSMLLVAASGLVGRYFYSKIHYGLYGSRVNFEELKLSSEVGMLRVGFLLDFSPTLSKRVQSFHATAMAPSSNVLHGILRILLMGFWTRWVYFAISSRMDRALKMEAQRRGWKRKVRDKQGRIARRHLAGYLATARKVVELNFYERLFALWHVLHLPLFVMLVITGIGHVVAVHMY
jgi:hypothetical protein